MSKLTVGLAPLAFKAKLLPSLIFAASLTLVGCGGSSNNNSNDDTPNNSGQAPELVISTTGLVEGSVSTATVVATFSGTDADNDQLTYTLLDNDKDYFVIKKDGCKY